MGERDVGLEEIPALWTRKLDAVAGKLQYWHARGTVVWTPVELLNYEAELARRRAAHREQAVPPPQPYAPAYPPPSH
eukprot:12431354-Alexandrium_andersonii.AAC.1